MTKVREILEGIDDLTEHESQVIQDTEMSEMPVYPSQIEGLQGIPGFTLKANQKVDLHQFKMQNMAADNRKDTIQ